MPILRARLQVRDGRTATDAAGNGTEIPWELIGIDHTGNRMLASGNHLLLLQAGLVPL